MVALYFIMVTQLLKLKVNNMSTLSDLPETVLILLPRVCDLHCHIDTPFEYSAANDIPIKKTFLIWAIEHDNFYLVRQLLQYGADPNFSPNYKDPNGVEVACPPPLSYALARPNSGDIIKALIHFGAHLEFVHLCHGVHTDINKDESNNNEIVRHRLPGTALDFNTNQWPYL